jgi:DNA polymerase-3 subunit beta
LKLRICKAEFLKSWGIAERATAQSSAIGAVTGVLLSVFGDKAAMMATDLRSSVTLAAEGILEAIELGEAVIPIRGVTELFKKSSAQEFLLEISEDGKAVMKSGKSRYRFSTYVAADFPKLTTSSDALPFCTLKASSLAAAIDRGAICASDRDEFPQYISAVFLETKGTGLNVVSTDKRRLSYCRAETTECGDDEKFMLLPFRALREAQRVLGTMDGETDVRVLSDDSQAYFVTSGIEFSVRRTVSNFPAYARIVPERFGTTATVRKDDLVSALERVDIVVHASNRTARLDIQPGGECVISGSAPEFGDAVETIACAAEGEPVRAAFNSKFLIDAAKSLASDLAELSFNGQGGHMMIRDKGSDSFFCLIAPVESGAGENSEEKAGA